MIIDSLIMVSDYFCFQFMTFTYNDNYLNNKLKNTVDFLFKQIIIKLKLI